MRFNYASTSRSSETSPCSNVPIQCPLCPVNSPAVWTYNIESHFHGRHKIVSPANFPVHFQLSESEKDGMKKKWESRYKFRKSRNMRNKKMPMVTSDAHSSRLALRSAFSFHI